MAQGKCVIEPGYIENRNLATFAAKLSRQSFLDQDLISGPDAFLAGAFALLCTDRNFAQHCLISAAEYLAVCCEDEGEENPP